MADQKRYIDEVAPSPIQQWGEPEPTVPRNAEALMRYAAAAGCGAAAIGVDMVGDRTQAGEVRHVLNCVVVAGHFDIVVALKALVELDPVKADEVAAWIIDAAEGGDAYGEWLWQWCDEMGMDADKLCEERRAAYEEWRTKHGTRPFRVEVYETKRVDAGPDGAITVTRYHWRAVHTSNGEVMASGEGYADKRDRDHAIDVLFPGVERVEAEA